MEKLSTIKDTYGYIWSDWLYHHHKDHFIIDVYNEYKRIEECVDATEKTAWLTLLREKLQHCNKPWVAGVLDFIDFETTCISSCNVPLDILADEEDYKALAIIDGAYRHGAFRGLCRTVCGAEWIGLMGEWCAAALHQGLKWMRVGKPLSEWELPSLGEAWCKGIAIWSMVCLYMIVDQAGDNPDNDHIIVRIHTVIAAHHMAGVNWRENRGEHPHRWFNPSIRGVAPCEQAIRLFGQKQAYPPDMINILCRAGDHVKQWINPPFNPIHLARTRGLLIGNHTPRLWARLNKVCDELINVAGDMTATEAEELKWRMASWLSGFSVHWRGRGDLKDTVLEITTTGAVTGVLRESRPHLTPAFVDGMIDWTRHRIHHLPHFRQENIMSAVKASLEIRGRIPGAVNGYTSAGLGHTRFIDGLWELAVMIIDLVISPEEATEFPRELQGLTIQHFNEWRGSKRIEGVDIPHGGDDAYGGCALCLPKDIFIALVDNQPNTGILQSCIWGALLYNNLGFGLPNDTSLGSVNHEKTEFFVSSELIKEGDSPK